MPVMEIDRVTRRYVKIQKRFCFHREKFGTIPIYRMFGKNWVSGIKKYLCWKNFDYQNNILGRIPVQGNFCSCRKPE